MPCTLSTQKRARLAPTMSSVSWASLPFDQVRSVGDCLLADNDIDDYMAFRAVCRDWRSATKSSNDDDGTDPAATARFIPTKWALLDRRDDDLVTLLNVDTGRFLSKRIPLLRQLSFLGATSGGLILLEESEEPHRARVLNPFTGSVAHFKVSIPCVAVRTVSMTTTPPLTVFISTASETGEILWADQSMESFERFWIGYPNKPTCMTSFCGNLYVTDRHGSIYLCTAAVGELRRDSAVYNPMDAAAAISPIIGNATADLGDPAQMSGRYYLVESAGDLLLVTKPSGFPNDQPVVRRVNMETGVIEQVSSIGSRALFVSHARCLSINVGKFPSVQGGCVYFLEPTATSYGIVDTTIVRVADNVVVEFAGGCCSSECFFRPFTLSQVITDYCKSVHSSKLYKMMMISMWRRWNSPYGDAESTISSELDDEESSSSEQDDDEVVSSFEPADD